jgi:NodT family efflux transporter outer membrane factor (OMF) lipoprotein
LFVPPSRSVATVGVSLLGLGLMLAGCATAPRLSAKPDIATPSSFATTKSFTAPRADWPTDAWWTAYGDPQLNALIATALKGSPDVAVAAARLDAARAQARAASAALGPVVTANASVSEPKQSYLLGIPPEFVPHGFNATGALTLNLNWDLDLWGRNRKLLAAATSDAQAAAADAAQARLVLSTSIASAYATLAQLYAERDVAQRAVEVRTETFDLTSQRVANGADTRAELKQAEAGPPQARADIAAQDEAIATTKNRIAALMGEGPDRGLTITRPTSGAPRAFGLPDNLAADLVGRRPDIVAARLRAEAFGKRVGAAKAAFYPDVNLAGLIGAEALPLKYLADRGAETAQIGPAISLPILDSGRLNASYRGARAGYDEAVADYDGALTTALREVADVAVAERALAVRRAESRAALADNEEAYRVARMRYEGGLSTFQSVLLVEDAVLQSRRIVADLDARAFLLDVQLVQALGGGFRGV